MATSAALTLLPPKQTTPSGTSLFATPTASKATDSSFKDALDSARQRKVEQEKTDDDKPVDKDKPAAKKVRKAVKAKHHSDVDEADESEESEPVEKAGKKSGHEPADTPVEDAAGKLKDAGKKTKAVKTTVKAEAKPTAEAGQGDKPAADEAKAEDSNSEAKLKTVDLRKAKVEDAGEAGGADGAADTDAAKGDEAAGADAPPVVSALDTDPALEPAENATVGKVHANENTSGNQENSSAAEAAAGASAAVASVSGGSTNVSSAGGDEVADVIGKITGAGGGSEHEGATVTTVDSSAAAPGAFAQQLQRATGTAAAAKADQGPAIPPGAQFVESNHPKIVTGIQGQLLPNGGSMQIRLDPAELGTLNVTVHMRDGVMTASFETSNENATRMLSHSLSDLKASLEQSGVSVEKLHVQQGAKHEPGGQQDSPQDKGQQNQDPSARREQQRRELMQRMWRKISGGDPLDLVA